MFLEDNIYKLNVKGYINNRIINIDIVLVCFLYNTILYDNNNNI